jgi:protoporphyrinogen/coproporphyrinogen III oxidase
VPSSAEAPIAVVGGGIAGLAAAHELHARGVPFVLLEASGRLGGVIRTERMGGFLLEAGPDAILAQKPEAVELCRALGLADRLISTNPDARAVYVLDRGRLHALPEGMVLGVPTRLGPLVRSRLFSWPAKLRMALEPLMRRAPAPGDESIASFLRRRLGREAVRKLGEPLLAGIHAGDAERLSIRATFPRLVEIEASEGSLMRAFLRGSAGGAPFRSLPDGLGEMVAALVAGLPARSCRTDAPVRALRPGAGGWLVEAGGQRPLEARAVILAVPAPRAAPLVQEVAPEAARRLSAIPFASTATVLLGYRRGDVRHPLDGYGLLVPRGEGLRTTALGFFSTKFPGRAPEGHVLLRGFLGGVHDQAVLDESDSRLAALVQEEMAGPLGLTGAPVLARVYRWPSATPQMEVGHLERMAALDRELAAVPGLFLTGSGLRGTGIPDTIGDATRAARQAAELAAPAPP